jgi:peptidyl-prolyl cis-trans isomerase A (cyclophilin A)
MLLFGLSAVPFVAQSASSSSVERPKADQADQAEQITEFVPNADWGRGHYARIETDAGRIIARLLPDQAPQSVAHFVAMAMGDLEWLDVVTGETRKGRYYDGIPIHNVRPGRLFEAGDWTGTGQGAPPIYVPEEGAGPINFSQSGRLGMARSGTKVSAVQFFATYAAQPELNRVFPCFGMVIEGVEVILKISESKAYNNGKPMQSLLIQTIDIFTIGNPGPIPRAEQIPTGKKKLELRPHLRRD